MCILNKTEWYKVQKCEQRVQMRADLIILNDINDLLGAMHVITTTISMLIMEMKDVAIQFYPIWPSLSISDLL